MKSPGGRVPEIETAACTQGGRSIKDPQRQREGSADGSETADTQPGFGFGRDALDTVSLGARLFSALVESLGDAPHVRLQETGLDAGFDVRTVSDGKVPQRIGRYEIVGEIARGGVGVVYRARDVELGRDTALKVLLHSENENACRRFVEEAQIGGQLQHPGIVQVHEIGLVGGRVPFFTMKLVKGQTFAAVLDGRARVTDDRQRLLSIFEQISQTLAYAHARGVIHRDLKPSNVMVGAFGETQVMDWGFAKVLSEGGVADERRAHKTHMDVSFIETIRSAGDGTQSLPGSVMGTPSYMPPEQAQGSVEDLDERSDVFGLGAILCEVLTGKPPYLGRSSKEVHEKALMAALDDANQRLDDCGADAEIVALAKKCLSPEPRDRPRDAASVAKVMRTYFDTMDKRTRAAELEAAKAQVRAKGERRARRLTLAIGMTVLLAMVAGGAGFYVLEEGRRERAAAATNAVERAVADASSLRSEAQAGEVDVAKWDQAVKEAERAVSLVTADVDDEVRAKARGFLVAVRDERSAAREFADRARSEKVLLAELEAVRLRQADADEEELAELASAYEKSWLRRGIDFRALAAAQAADRIRPSFAAEDLARTLDDWSAALGKSGSDSDLLWKKLLAVALQVDRDGKRSAIRNAVLADDLKALKDMASGVLAANRFRAKGQLPARTFDLLAAALLRLGSEVTVQELATRAQLVHPGDFWLQHRLGQLHAGRDPPDLAVAHRHVVATISLRKGNPHSWFDFGRLLAAQGDPDGAARVLRRALELPGHDPAVRTHLADALTRTGDFAAAVEVYRDVIASKPHDQKLLRKLGNTLAKARKTEEATAAYRRALEIDSGDADTHHRLGKVLEEMSREGKAKLEDAAAAYRRAAELSPEVAEYSLRLGKLLLELGEAEEAERRASKAVEVDAESSRAHETLGLVLARRGKMAEARKAFEDYVRLAPDEAVVETARSRLVRRAEDVEIDRGERKRRAGLKTALDVFRQALERNPGSAEIETHVAIFQMRLGDPGGAIATFRDVLGRDGDSALAHGGLGLALLLEARKRQDAATLEQGAAALKKAVEIAPGDAAFRNNLAVVLYEKKRSSEAIAELRKSIQAGPRSSTAHFNLGQILFRDERFAEAVNSYRNATENDGENVEALLRLGGALLEVFKWHEALASFRRALELDPRQARALAGLAKTLHRLGRLDEALARVKESLQLDSLDARTHDIHGQVLASRGEMVAAADAFWQAIRLDRNLAEAAEHLGAVELEREDFPRAMDAFRRALRADPTRTGPYSEILKLLENDDVEFHDAIDNLITTLDEVVAAPSDVRPEAEDVFLAAWSRNPRGGVKLNPVELAARKAEESGRKDSRVLGILARVLFAAGKRSEAVLTLEDALSVAGLTGAPTTKLEELLHRYRVAILPDLVSYRSIDAAIEKPETLIAASASWRYFPGVEEPSPDLGWTRKDFDDSQWLESASPFRYGEVGRGTLLEDMIGSYTTLYLRRTFELERPERFSRISLAVTADDGFVAYLNGREVGRARAGVAGERLAHDGRASDSAIEPLETEWVELPPELLVEGENLLAIQGVNDFAANLDFFLGIEVLGEPGPGEDEARFRAYRENSTGKATPVRLLYLDGRLLQRQGRHADAAEVFRRVLDQDRRHKAPFLRLAESLKAGRDVGKAYRTLKGELAKGTVPAALVELPPEVPRNLQPPAGASTEGPVVVLEATPFFRYERADSHFRSHWQIRAEGSSYARNPTFDGYSQADLDSWTPPRGLLSPGVRYYWRVAYSGQEGQNSGFSEETAFTMAEFPLEAVTFDLAAHFNRDVVADPGDEENDDLDGGGWALIVDGYDGERTDRVDADGLPINRAVGVHRLASYGGRNSVQATGQDKDEVRIAVPRGRYASLAFLVAGGNGSSAVPLTLEYAGGSSESAVLACPDWFEDPEETRQAGCNPVWNGMDRIALRSGTVQERDDAALFEIRLPLRSDRELVTVVLRPGDGQYADPFVTRFNLFSIVGIRADG